MRVISEGLVALFDRVKDRNCSRLKTGKSILDLNDIKDLSIGAKNVVVNLPWKGIDDSVLRDLLSQFDERKYSITELRLPFNEITSNGARLLAKWIEKNPQLAVFDLSHNHAVSPKGWERLCRAWGTRNSKELILGAGRFSDVSSTVRLVSVFQPSQN